VVNLTLLKHAQIATRHVSTVRGCPKRNAPPRPCTYAARPTRESSDGRATWQDGAVPTAYTRRALLRTALAVTGAAAAAGLGGCDPFGKQESPANADPGLSEFLADTVALGEQYRRAISDESDLTALLTPIRDAHKAHAAKLAEALGVAVPSASAAPSMSGDRGTVIAALRKAETEAKDKAVAACVAAPNQFAPLVGSIAAARATHLEVLV
jgi:hypothetical protein